MSATKDRGDPSSAGTPAGRVEPGLQVNATYPELAEALAAAQEGGDFLVDGEVVTFAGQVTSLARLQRRLGLRRDKDPASVTRAVARP